MAQRESGKIAFILDFILIMYITNIFCRQDKIVTAVSEIQFAEIILMLMNVEFFKFD